MKIVLSLSAILILLAGCGPSQEEVATQTSSALTSTAAIWTKTATPTSTNTATPTSTPTPSITPIPTSTPFAGLQLDKLIAYKINWTGRSYGYTGDIEISLPNGGNPINISNDQSGNKILGGWSPDGKIIVYGRWEGENINVTARDASASPMELWKMDSDGSNKSRLPIDVVANDVFIVSNRNNWNDENLLIPCLTGGGQTELCIVNVTESTVQKTGNYGEVPSYSPDRKAYSWQITKRGGDAINAFLSNQNLSDLFVIRKEERYPVKLPMPTKKQIEGYGWLPDSENLIVLFTDKNLGEIYKMQADGTKEPVLVLRTKAKFGFLGWVGLSPDGKYLLIEDFAIIGNQAKGIGCIVNLFEKTTVCIDQGYNRFIWTPDGQVVGQKDGIAYVFDLITAKPTQADQLNWLYSHLRVLLQP